jgi:hypothetical protein
MGGGLRTGERSTEKMRANQGRGVASCWLNSKNFNIKDFTVSVVKLDERNLLPN